MESENSFDKLKNFVSKKRFVFNNLELHPKTDEVTAAVDLFNAETVQNIVEAALIDGISEPDAFLENMMNECEVNNFEEIAKEYGDQDRGDDLYIDFHRAYLKMLQNSRVNDGV